MVISSFPDGYPKMKHLRLNNKRQETGTLLSNSLPATAIHDAQNSPFMPFRSCLLFSFHSNH